MVIIYSKIILILRPTSTRLLGRGEFLDLTELLGVRQRFCYEDWGFDCEDVVFLSKHHTFDKGLDVEKGRFIG